MEVSHHKQRSVRVIIGAMLPLHKGQRLTEAIRPFLASPDTSRWPGGLSPQWRRHVLCFILSQAFGPASLQPLIPKLAKGARQRRLCSECAGKAGEEPTKWTSASSSLL